jgi:NADH-quinone oxidoreductase subunit N
MIRILAQQAASVGNPTIDYRAILPELILAGTALLVLVLDLFLPRGRKHVAMPFAFVGVAASLLATLSLVGDPRSTFDGAYVVDNYAVLFKTFFLVTALVVLLISYRFVKDGRYYQGEYYFLLLCSFLGMVTMPSSRDLLMMFISLELVSAPAFLLAGFRKSDPRSNEAALKFFLIGVLSTAVMLYGISLVYGITGSITLSGIAEGLAGATGRQPIVLAAILLVVVGFAFKVSSVPFQFWAPDTYEGAPVPIAAFLSVGSKAAGFAGLLQLMFVAFIGQAEFWAPIFAVLSILTMTLGNLVAMQQRQVVRLLAYSSIAQAGYMLLPFALAGQSASLDKSAFAAVVLYLLIYGAMNLGTFAIVIGESGESSGLLVSDFAGFGIRAPALAVAMTTFLVSLAGIPPTAGFWAKFSIFAVAIDHGGYGPWLAGVMVVNSVISIVYYFAVVRAMWLDPVTEPVKPVRFPAQISLVAGLATLTVLAVGIYPTLLSHFPPLSTLAGQ